MTTLSRIKEETSTMFIVILFLAITIYSGFRKSQMTHDKTVIDVNMTFHQE